LKSGLVRDFRVQSTVFGIVGNAASINAVHRERELAVFSNDILYNIARVTGDDIDGDK
jgi:hypothetical protein